MRNFNLFVSHSWNYDGHYQSLISRLQNRPYFSCSNYSVPQQNPIEGARTKAQLKQAITYRMRPCQAIIIPAGVYATNSEWINVELELAYSWGKAIIGVRPQGAERISSVVQDYATEMVGWNIDSIVEAIRRHVR